MSSPGAGGTRRFRGCLEAASSLLGCLAWGTPQDPAIRQSPGSEGALVKNADPWANLVPWSPNVRGVAWESEYSVRFLVPLMGSQLWGLHGTAGVDD